MYVCACMRSEERRVGKVGKQLTFRYDLYHIPYDYTVEVRNRFKGLDLIHRVPDELWTEVRDIVQETGSGTAEEFLIRYHQYDCRNDRQRKTDIHKYARI